MVSLDNWLLKARIGKSRLKNATPARILERLLFAWIWGTAAAFFSGAILLAVAGVLSLSDLLGIYLLLNVLTLVLAAALYAVQGAR